MAYVYLFCSSLLMYFISAAAALGRDEHDGAAWIFLAVFTSVITLIRTASTVSKRLYKKYSGEAKKLTITDILISDAAMFILYGLAAGFAHDLKNITAWVLMFIVGIPTLVISLLIIIDRFKSSFELKKDSCE